LVENGRGEILFIQRGYGKEKGKWSLPGGFVDPGERSKHAARRETREETGLAVKVISTVRVNGDNTAKVFAGRVVGGKLQYQRRECLDVRFRDPARMKTGDLAFDSDQRALQTWEKMKHRHRALKTSPLPGRCPRCEGSSVRLRQDPHHKSYRCRSCKRTF
jgi:ADP-ribose pyrophosphatase YjhB (NUDIX family)